MRTAFLRSSPRLAAAALVATAVAVAACGTSRRAADTTPPEATGVPPGTHTTGGEVVALQSRFVEIVDAVSPAVVQIRTSVGLGSGIVFDRRGDVVTNAHVVGGSRAFAVKLMDGRRVGARLVGVDRGNDLAVIRLSGAAPAPAQFADSSKIRVGDLALAIGSPLGLASSVTQGIVSSTDREVSEGNGVTLSSAIQTSAPINPGNSGGALVDLDGHVIGIPTLAALDPELGDTPAPGIGFAIAGNRVRTVAQRIIAAHGDSMQVSTP
jgi:putative serine protease PepD